MTGARRCMSFFFFNDTATTEIYTLSLHDALPISCAAASESCVSPASGLVSSITCISVQPSTKDRKSTRLNSSHSQISYAVFCLKKKKNVLHHSVQPQSDHSKNERAPAPQARFFER